MPKAKKKRVRFTVMKEPPDSAERQLRLIERAVAITRARKLTDPRRVLGVSSFSGQLFIQLEFDEGLRGVLPAAEVNLSWPQLVISFYESHIEWQNEEASPEETNGFTPPRMNGKL